MSRNELPLGLDPPQLISRRTVLKGALIAAASTAMARAYGESPRGRAPIGARSRGRSSMLQRERHTTTETVFGRMIAGGYCLGALSSVQIFDGTNWFDAPPLLLPRCDHAAVAYPDGLLVMGGLSSTGDFLTSVEWFNGSRWTRVAPMKIAKISAAAVMFNGTPVVTGGRNRSLLSAVEQFDGSVWRPMPPLRTPRFGHKASIQDGLLTVSGGEYLLALTDSEAFDGSRWIPGIAAAPQLL